MARTARTARTEQDIITAILQNLEQRLETAQIGVEHDSIIRLMGVLTLRLFRAEQKGEQNGNKRYDR